MKLKPVTVGVVGAGAISDIFLTNMTTRFPILQVKSICAGHIENARVKAEKYGILWDQPARICGGYLCCAQDLRKIPAGLQLRHLEGCGGCGVLCDLPLHQEVRRL